MDAALQVKRVHSDEFEIRYCIICQKKDEKGLVSNTNGRTKLMDFISFKSYTEIEYRIVDFYIFTIMGKYKQSNHPRAVPDYCFIICPVSYISCTLARFFIFLHFSFAMKPCLVPTNSHINNNANTRGRDNLHT